MSNIVLNFVSMQAAEEKTTRDKLLEAAERLFLKKGYEGVSIRDITDSAGANVAAINYHFGGKENLYREFFRLKASLKAQEVIAKLKAAIAEDDPPDMRKVVSTYVSEFLGEFLHSREAQKFLQLVSQEMSEQGLAADIFLGEVVMPIHKLLKDAISRARPGLSGEKASLCIASVVGQMMHFVRARDVIKHAVGRGYSKEFVEEIIEHITEFSLRGIGD
jgi:AcrR family transcriptional regulator